MVNPWLGPVVNFTVTYAPKTPSKQKSKQKVVSDYFNSRKLIQFHNKANFSKEKLDFPSLSNDKQLNSFKQDHIFIT